MNATQEQVVTTPLKSTELDLNGSKDLPRRLIVSLSHGGFIYARTLERKRKGSSHRAFAWASNPLGDCSILSSKADDDLPTLIVDGTHFPLTRDEARQLVETFGLREWS